MVNQLTVMIIGGGGGGVGGRRRIIASAAGVVLGEALGEINIAGDGVAADALELTDGI